MLTHRQECRLPGFLKLSGPPLTLCAEQGKQRFVAPVRALSGCCSRRQSCRHLKLACVQAIERIRGQRAREDADLRDNDAASGGVML